MEKKKEILTIVLPSVIIFGLSVIGLFLPDRNYSDAERRGLATSPQLSAESVASGKYQEKFETYALDQFPFRDFFRKTKAYTNYYVFLNKDNNGYYKKMGHIAKIEYPLNEAKLMASLKKQQDIYTQFIKDSNCKIYTSVIPDKNYYLAPTCGYLSMDYDKYVETVIENETYAQYIDIFDCLNLDSYYYTDPHWKQEKIRPVTERLCKAMGNKKESETEYELCETHVPFMGAYYEQACLPAKPDEIKYLNNKIIQQCKVTYYDADINKNVGVYDTGKLDKKDPYEMFLSGAQALIEIENPDCYSPKELVMFRDSFGSSLAPLFIDSYSKITLVDIRYVNPEKLGQLIDFNSQDVLFIYSTMTF